MSDPPRPHLHTPIPEWFHSLTKSTILVCLVKHYKPTKSICLPDVQMGEWTTRKHMSHRSTLSCDYNKNLLSYVAQHSLTTKGLSAWQSSERPYVTYYMYFIQTLVIRCTINEIQPLERYVTLIWPLKIIKGHKVNWKIIYVLHTNIGHSRHQTLLRITHLAHRKSYLINCPLFPFEHVESNQHNCAIKYRHHCFYYSNSFMIENKMIGLFFTASSISCKQTRCKNRIIINGYINGSYG